MGLVTNLQSIRSHAIVHDKTKAEFKFHYNFSREKFKNSSFLNRKQEVRQQIYFVFPGQWRISDSTFPTSDFIQELQHFFRFREPYVKLSFISPKIVEEDSPYKQLVESIERLKVKHDKTEIQEVRRLICAFGAGYSSQFSKRIDKQLQRLSRYLEFDEPAFDEENIKQIKKHLFVLNQTIRKSYVVMRNWRSMLDQLMGQEVLDFYKPILEEFFLLDEYCSTLFVDALGSVRQYLQSSHLDKIEWQLDNNLKDLELTLHSHLRLERAYQKKRSFKFARTKNRLGKEYALSRFRALKRHIWSVLYTKSQKKSRIEVSKHLGSSFAAGFAALWALLANVFIFWYYPDILQGGEGMQTLIGVNGLFAMGSVVLAYIIKDRIKEIGRSAFRKLGNESVDQSIDITYVEAGGETLPICLMHEAAKFQHHGDLPPKVFEMFRKHSIDFDLDLAERSSVLKLDRQLVFDLNGIRDARSPSSSVSDILRVNFNRFQSIMSEPRKQMYVLDDDGEVVAMRLPKVYYCDVVIVTKGKTMQSQEDTHYQYRRFVLNKRGLIRCDHLE